MIFQLTCSEGAVSEIRRSSQQQRRFLRLLRDIRSHWKAQKVPYASHVYEKGETTVGRLFNNFWNL